MAILGQTRQVIEQEQLALARLPDVSDPELPFSVSQSGFSATAPVAVACKASSFSIVELSPVSTVKDVVTACSVPVASSYGTSDPGPHGNEVDPHSINENVGDPEIDLEKLADSGSHRGFRCFVLKFIWSDLMYLCSSLI